MTPDYARPVFGIRRKGWFEWKTFAWNDYKICPITIELAETVGWKRKDAKLVIGPYRLKVVSISPETNTLYGMRISGELEETVRRFFIFFKDLITRRPKL